VTHQRSDTTPIDFTRSLRSDAGVEAFFNDAWESESPVEIADALSLIALAKGSEAQAALEAAGLPADYHERAPDWAEPPEWAVILKAIKALGLKLTGAVAAKPAA